MTEISLNSTQTQVAQCVPLSGKILLAGYGTLSYLIGCSGLVALILSMGGVIPMGGWVEIAPNAAVAVVINVLLTGLFGVQHSVMARPFFKQGFKRIFGAASERATFVWTSGATLLLILALWQSVPGTLWALDDGIAQVLMWVLFVAGWGYLFAATFAIDHFDLFGLRQVWFALRDRRYEPPRFKEHWMYRYSRHPIMLGALAGLWFLPVMNATQLVMTLTMTAYVFIGVLFEERDLARTFGARYLDYKRRVGMFFTLGKQD